MPLFNNRLIRLSFAVALGALVLWKGVVPALTTIDTDFPNYYVASRIVIDHGDISHVYNDAWFSAQAVAMGLNAQARFSPFPPATVFVMIPFAWLPPLSALQLWTVFNLGVLGAIIYLLSKITSRDVVWCATLVFASGHALINNFRFGQFYIVLLLCCVVIYRGIQTNRHFAAGVLLGLGAVIKYFPALYFLSLVAKRQWQTIVWGICTVAALMGTAWMVVGTEANLHWISNLLIHHAQGDVAGQSSNSALFESWNSLLKRLFVKDILTNPMPMGDWPEAYSIGLMAIVVAICDATFFALLRLKKLDRDQALPLLWALLTFAAFTLLPISATYHVLLLVLPVGLMLRSEGSWSVQQKIIAAAYIAIAFFPYSLVAGFEGRGALSALAFPRLYLLCGMFGAILWKIISLPRPVR